MTMIFSIPLDCSIEHDPEKDAYDIELSVGSMLCFKGQTPAMDYAEAQDQLHLLLEEAFKSLIERALDTGECCQGWELDGVVHAKYLTLKHTRES